MTNFIGHSSVAASGKEANSLLPLLCRVVFSAPSSPLPLIGCCVPPTNERKLVMEEKGGKEIHRS